MDNMQLGALIADVLGIVLVLAGGFESYYHGAKSSAGLALFWVGWILLIIALIIMLMNMRKPMSMPMQKTS